MTDDEARALLTEARERTERELASLSAGDADDAQPVLDEAGDVGTELYEREQNVGRADDLRGRLAEIDAALQRVADGTYGRSTLSGEPIPDGRLQAIPWATLTAEEQAAQR